MSVSQVLQELARQAGASRLIRGQLIGDAVSGLSQLPAQILSDRDQARRQAALDAREHDSYQRRLRGDQREEAAAAAEQFQQAAAHEIIKAYTGGTPNDPTSNNLDAGIARAKALDLPEFIPKLQAMDQAERERHQVKLTEYDPSKGLENRATGEIVRAPAEKGMTPAEQALRAETARHNQALEANAALTTGRAEAAQQETARHNRASEAAAAAAANPFSGVGAPVDLDRLPAALRDQAQALVDGRRALDPRLASKPVGQTIINAAYLIDPTFDQGNYNARAKARTDLTSPNGTGGKTIGALNTAIQHAGQLSDLIEHLDNFEAPAANAIVNPIRTAFGSTKVTNYDVVAPQLAKEIERVWRGAGGTAGEIHDLIGTIGHNKGKQQQREALQHFVDLAQGKLDTLVQQRDSVLGAAGASIPILFEKNQGILDRIAQRASGKPAPDPAAPAAPKRIVYGRDGKPVK